MEEYDKVRLIAEKEKYAKRGIHKEHLGTIIDPRNINGCWLVIFDGVMTEEGVFLVDEVEMPVKEEDLEVVELSKYH